MSGSPGWLDANREFWDERVPLHLGSDFYDVEGFRAGRDTIPRHHVVELGDVCGQNLLHLQCHIGLDTLSWARRGARVVGLDLSQAAIEAARDLNQALDLDAEFVVADVYDAAEALRGRTFDAVYTGRGALCWLPDLDRWARTVAGLLRPRGVLYLEEAHPFHEILDDDDLTIRRDYLGSERMVFEDPGSYADPDAPTVHNRRYEWVHPLGEVISAVADAGLRVDLVREREGIWWQRWPFMERREDGLWHLPAGMPRIPLRYSLRATRA